MLLDHLTDASAVPPWIIDWCDFTKADEVVTANEFTLTAILSGTLAFQAANGGWGRASAAATTSASGIQGQKPAAHLIIDNRKIEYKARFQINETTSANGANLSSVIFGLFNVGATLDSAPPSDGVFFKKASGGTAWTINVRAASATPSGMSAITIPNVADKLIHTVGIEIAPRAGGTDTTITFTMDGVIVGQFNGTPGFTAAVALAASFSYLSGDNTGTKFVDIDYIGSAQQRP